MNFYTSRRLSPIPNSDEHESVLGADVQDIPFYRTPKTPTRKTSLELGRKPPSHPPPHTRELDALITSPPLSPLQAPQVSTKITDFVDLDFGMSYEGERRSQDEPARTEELLSRLDFADRPESRPGSRADTGTRYHRQGNSVQALSSPTTDGSATRSHSLSDRSSDHTSATSLPALQQKGADENDPLRPLDEDDLDPGSFDLVATVPEGLKQYSLETRSEQLFSTEHLQIIFSDPTLLLRFTSFLSSHRPESVPVLIYYLDAIKALKAIRYSNAIAEALEPIPGFDFTATTAVKTLNAGLEEKAEQAFAALVREDLPAYITHIYTQTVSLSIQKRVTGTLPPSLIDHSEGLAEVFCLTDASRPDNPIVFASEAFHRTTQYGMSYVLGRNCRFLQGPKTNPHSVRRIRDRVRAGVESCEVFLNYRRDGSPFMNLLMCAPLCDSRGKIKYFIGAQVDVSGLVKECSDMESLRRLITKTEEEEARDPNDDLEYVVKNAPLKDEFRELSTMLNPGELETVRKWGGRMHKEVEEVSQDTSFKGGNWTKPRLLIHSQSPEGGTACPKSSRISGHLSGIYENYLLVRPYPSLLILFASPSLRVPGILQSPFMSKIGGSNRVREELTRALADGRGVTAKIKWVSKNDLEGRNRWIHCTPLIGSNGAVGVWMVVIVDDEASTAPSKRFKTAPPVDPKFGRSIPTTIHGDSDSLRDFAMLKGVRSRDGRTRDNSSLKSYLSHHDSHGSSSAYSLRI
ncbi:white collar [Diplocarpon rosae]|nr:white collar [Diplocarpon rosae]